MAGDGPRIPTDQLADRLTLIYEQAARRLRLMIRQAPPASWTAEFRQARLAEVAAIIDRLRREAAPLGAAVVEGAYSAAVLATDTMAAGPAVAFGRVHAQAVDVLARSLVGRLDVACQTVGRSLDDVYRRTVLTEIAGGQAAGDATAAVTRRAAAELERQGLTCLVDRGGKRWALDTYSRMAVRTGLREAVTVAQVNRLNEREIDLVTISDHATTTPLCQEFEGNTYSLSGSSSVYPILTDYPPLHPSCQHVLTPAAANLDDLESALAGTLP